MAMWQVLTAVAAPDAFRRAAPLVIRPCAAGFSLQDGVDQILHRVGFGHHAIRQAHAASIAEAQHEFHALKTAEAEFAFEVRLRAAGGKFFEAPRAIELNEELPHGG